MEIKTIDLGNVDYDSAYACQKKSFSEIKSGLYNFSLILCSHYPVITFGRSFKPENLLVDELDLKKSGIQLRRTERGGDITYHGPGQITAYPIFNLNYLKKDIHWHLRKIEEAAINLFSEFGIQARRIPGLTGVWLEDGKLASIGIAVRNWITFHGISINIKGDDLANFSLIRPCGMNIKMACLEQKTGKAADYKKIKSSIIEKFKEAYQ